MDNIIKKEFKEYIFRKEKARTNTFLLLNSIIFYWFSMILVLVEPKYFWANFLIILSIYSLFNLTDFTYLRYIKKGVKFNFNEELDLERFKKFESQFRKHKDTERMRIKEVKEMEMEFEEFKK